MFDFQQKGWFLKDKNAACVLIYKSQYRQAGFYSRKPLISLIRDKIISDVR